MSELITTTIIEDPEIGVIRILEGTPGPRGLPGPAPEEWMVYATRVDWISETELYKGQAAPGSSESASVWRIRKIVLGADNDVTETWAGGTAEFDKKWSERTSLSYS